MAKERTDRFVGDVDDVAVTLPDGTVMGNEQAQRGPLTALDFAEMLAEIKDIEARNREQGKPE